MTKRSKACDIPKDVKMTVFERDGGLCILCGYAGLPNAHYIPRSHGGLGIEQNIVTLCPNCHYAYDNTDKRKKLGAKISEYLSNRYSYWNESKLYYRKGQNYE